MYKKSKERGQAIVLIALAILGLVSLTALAIDGGNAFAENRQAQNAADSAAFSAALIKIRGGGTSDITTAVNNIAANNGFDVNDPDTSITINIPPQSGYYADCYSSDFNCYEYIQVIITSLTDTYFAPVIGITKTNVYAEAVVRAKAPETTVFFEGNAVVGLNPNTNSSGSYPCGFDSGNSNAADWKLTGGGIFSNGCAYSKNNDSVSLPTNPAKCVTTVGPAYNFTCMNTNQASSKYSTNDIQNIMPPTPACDNTAEGGYVVPSSPSSFTFTNGVYCVSDFDAFRQEDIVLDNATLYITDTNFDVKFAGQGGFAGNATTSGTYAGYYMIIAMSDTPCQRYQDNNVQSIEFRGNGVAGVVGTILAPTACIDFRGNANGATTHSQVIGYNVTSNGNAELDIQYDPEENAEAFVPPQIELAE